LAKRGNEVFTVVNNQIRWSSLTRLKDVWQQQSRSKKDASGQTMISEGPLDSDETDYYRVWPILAQAFACLAQCRG
jgi:nucleoporin NUP82